MRTLALPLIALAAGCAGSFEEGMPCDPIRAISVADVHNGDLADVDAFYAALADDGTWMQSDDYGDVWCPGPQVAGGEFTPYTRGHFEYGLDGWTWIGDSDVSWAVEHYGRWEEIGEPGCEWAWIPDGEWSPAWVDFEIGDGMVAWSPRHWGHHGKKVRVRNTPQQRQSMPHVSGGGDKPRPEGSAPSTVGMAKTPGAAAKAAAEALEKSTANIEHRDPVVVAVVRETDFLAPDIYPRMLVGSARTAAIANLQPVASPTANDLVRQGDTVVVRPSFHSPTMDHLVPHISFSHAAWSGSPPVYSPSSSWSSSGGGGGGSFFGHSSSGGSSSSPTYRSSSSSPFSHATSHSSSSSSSSSSHSSSGSSSSHFAHH